MVQRGTEIIVLVHGTFASHAGWVQPRSDLAAALRRDASALIIPFCWSGANSHNARIRAGRELRELLDRIDSEVRPSRKTLVAHSHGGNVAAYALGKQDEADRPWRLIALGTPFLTFRERRSFARVQLFGAIALLVLALFAMALQSVGDTGIFVGVGRFVAVGLAWILVGALVLVAIVSAVLQLVRSRWGSRFGPPSATDLVLADQSAAKPVNVVALFDEARIGLLASRWVAGLSVLCVEIAGLALGARWVGEAALSGDLSSPSFGLVGAIWFLALGPGVALGVLPIGVDAPVLAYRLDQGVALAPPGRCRVLRIRDREAKGLRHSAPYKSGAGIEAIVRERRGEVSGETVEQEVSGPVQPLREGRWLLRLSATLLLLVAVAFTAELDSLLARQAALEPVGAYQVSPREVAERRTAGYRLLQVGYADGATTTADGWKRVTHPDAALSIEVPESWEVVDMTGRQLVGWMHLASDDGRIFVEQLAPARLIHEAHHGGFVYLSDNSGVTRTELDMAVRGFIEPISKRLGCEAEFGGSASPLSSWVRLAGCAGFDDSGYALVVDPTNQTAVAIDLLGFDIEHAVATLGQVAHDGVEISLVVGDEVEAQLDVGGLPDEPNDVPLVPDLTPDWINRLWAVGVAVVAAILLVGVWEGLRIASRAT